MNKMADVTGAFADLLNALDDFRSEATERGEEAIDTAVAQIEVAQRAFEAAFAEREAER